MIIRQLSAKAVLFRYPENSELRKIKEAKQVKREYSKVREIKLVEMKTKVLGRKKFTAVRGMLQGTLKSNVFRVRAATTAMSAEKDDRVCKVGFRLPAYTLVSHLSLQPGRALS